VCVPVRRDKAGPRLAADQFVDVTFFA
jgi:hypothetical protein